MCCECYHILPPDPGQTSLMRVVDQYELRDHEILDCTLSRRGREGSTVARWDIEHRYLGRGGKY